MEGKDVGGLVVIIARPVIRKPLWREHSPQEKKIPQRQE
jgi:hypothetical protein